MTCEQYQRWISDELDGVLGDKKKRRLESHLGACSSCRAYRSDLSRIQAEIKSEKASPVAGDYFEKLGAAIGTKLRGEKEGVGRVGRGAWGWRWAWIFAPLSLALVLGIAFIHSGREGLRHEIFSYEGCLDRVFQEIGTNDEVAAEFNGLLSSSLLEGSEAVVLEEDIDLWNEPLFWRNLSDEDLRSIEEGIKKGMPS
jgi:hypothetical protein